MIVELKVIEEDGNLYLINRGYSVRRGISNYRYGQIWEGGFLEFDNIKCLNGDEIPPLLTAAELTEIAKFMRNYEKKLCGMTFKAEKHDL